MTFAGSVIISKSDYMGKNDKSSLALQWQDIKAKEGKVQILLWGSKADQLGKGSQITLGQWSISSICLVKISQP